MIDMVCHSRSADVTFGRGPSLMSRGPIDLHSVRMAFLWCCDNVSGVANQSDNTPSVLGPANKDGDYRPQGWARLGCLVLKYYY